MQTNRKIYVGIFCIVRYGIASDLAIAQDGTGNAQQAVWWLPIATAILTATATIFAIILKDNIFERSKEQRQRTESQKEIYRNYATPLAASCEKLVWRFGEIFIQESHAFLKKGTLPLIYNEYKRNSTLYRLAALLGWIRAIHLELSSLTQDQTQLQTSFASARDAMVTISKAFADGEHVELHRLQQICDVWRYDLRNLEDSRLKRIAAGFEVQLYQHAGNELKHDSRFLFKLDKEKQVKICFDLAQYLAKEVGRTSISEKIVAETVNLAINALSYREALIYREWQDAIGDMMLVRDEDSARRYKIVGYEEFDDLLKRNHIWIEVFRDSIIDIDFTEVDPNDFRAPQLKKVARGVSELLLSLENSQGEVSVYAPAAMKARELLEKTKLS